MLKILILEDIDVIGQYLVKELSDKPDFFVSVVSNQRKRNYKNINYLYGNAKDREFLESLFQDSYDCIVDCMSWSTEEFKNIFNLLLSNCNHYVFFSSYRVYADIGMEPLNENSPLLLDTCKDEEYLQTDDYPLAKARCERILQNSEYKNYTILRPALTFDSSRYQISMPESDLITSRILDGMPLLLPKELMDKEVTMISANMAAKMIVPLLMIDDAKSEIFNVGGRESHTWRTIAGYFHVLFGTDYIFIDIKDYLKFGFQYYKIKYDTILNRILDNNKILKFVELYNTDFKYQDSFNFLKNKNISINKLRSLTKRNLNISYKMDNYIIKHKNKIHLFYGDKSDLFEIIKKIYVKRKRIVTNLIKSINDLITKKDYSQALENCSQLSKISPKNNDAYLKSYKIFCKLNDFDNAENILEQGMRNIPQDHNLWIASYDLAMSKKDYSLAMNRALEMIQKFPKLISGYVSAANTSMLTGEFDKAEDYCSLGFKLDYKDVQIWLIYAEIKMRKADYKEALQCWSKFRDLFPTRQEGYTRAAEACFKLNELDTVLQYCRDCLNVLPYCGEALIIAIEAAMHKKDFKLALEISEERQKKFPNLCSGYFRAAKAYLELGEYDKADEMAKRGVEVEPKAWVPWLVYAEIPMQKGDYKEALNRFAKFRDLFPNRHEGYIRAAEACFKLNELDTVLHYCRDCLNVLPNCGEALITAFEAAMHKKDFKLALEISEERQKKFPNLCSGYFRAAKAYMEMGEYDKADEMAKRGVEVEPEVCVPWMVYADIPMRQGNFELALDRLSEVRAKFPNELAGYTKAAHAYKQLGNFKKAREICEQGMLIGDEAFKILTYTIAEIMAQAPENYFCSIDYLYNLFEKLDDTRELGHFYSRLYHCGILLVHKFNNEDGDYYFDLILKIFLCDKYGENSSGSFLTFLANCEKNGDECKKRIDQIIDKYKIVSDFTTLIYTKSTVMQKKDAICNILRLNKNICVLQLLSLTGDFDDYKQIIIEITADINILSTFSDYGLYILFNLIEFLNIENSELVTDILLQIKDKNSEIYSFLKYRKFNYKILQKNKPVRYNFKTLRIAVCVSGQLRAYKKAFESWNKAFNFEKCEISYFVHTWKNIGRKLPGAYMFYPRTFNGEFLKAYQQIDPSLDYIKRYYNNLYNLLVGYSEIKYKDLNLFYNTDRIVIDDEQSTLFKNFNNMQKMHYKIYACNEFLYQPINKFDLVIRIRPDINIISNKTIDLYQIYEDSLKNNVIYSNTKHAAFWTHEMVQGDSLAIGTQPLMNIYSRTYIDHDKFYTIKHFQHRYNLIQHLSLSYQLLAHGIGMKDLSIKYTFMDPDPLPINDIYNAIKMDVSTHPQLTYEDKIFLNACERDLEKYD